MSLKLFVVRHGIATLRAPGADDAARPLTDEGAALFGQEVRGLAVLGVVLDAILHSPWLRAAQTAELLLPLLRKGGRIHALPELARAPGPSLLDVSRKGRIAMVGHEPWLSELIAWLGTGDPGDAAGLELKKGAVAILEGELRPGSMVLRALLPPKVLRLLGDAAESQR